MTAQRQSNDMPRTKRKAWEMPPRHLASRLLLQDPKAGGHLGLASPGGPTHPPASENFSSEEK